MSFQKNQEITVFMLSSCCSVWIYPSS